MGWWPPRLLRQPQSPLGPFGALLGMELGWTGLGLCLGGLGTQGLGTRVGLDNMKVKMERQEKQGEFNIQEEREVKKGPHHGPRFLYKILTLHLTWEYPTIQ